jgi:uncharacterized membrane protein
VGLAKTSFLVGLIAFMLVAGLNHFRHPDLYAALIPGWVPARLALVYGTGVMEMGFGLALIVPSWRHWAAWGVVITLILIFPANIYMAVSGGLADPALPRSFSNPTVAWGRLPFQALFIWWAWVFTE